MKSNINNIRFFSEQSQELILKLFASSLSEEEMQSALKWKERKNKIKKALKTLGGIGLGAAALYGASKWYNNGGKDKVSAVTDAASGFIQRTGDDAINTAKDTLAKIQGLEAERSRLVEKKSDLEEELRAEEAKPTSTDENIGNLIDEFERNKGTLNHELDVAKARYGEHRGSDWLQNPVKMAKLHSEITELERQIEEIDKQIATLKLAQNGPLH